MRLSTRVIAMVMAAMVAAFGWVMPAHAEGATPDKTNSASYWKAQYPNAVECYKHEGNQGAAHGTIVAGGKAVELKPFVASWPGDRWEVLIVKGAGNGSGDDGKGNAIYELPKAGTKYYAPVNTGGQVASVSHWIVCKGTTPTSFDWNWKYPAPTCAALSVTWPSALPHAPLDAKVRIINNATQASVTLEWKSPTDAGWAKGQQHTFRYADHPQWPGWKHYTVTWVQVHGTNYHWEGSVTCGEPEPDPVDICVWDTDTQSAVKTSVASLGSGDVPWVDGSECTPSVDVCEWKEGSASKTTVLATDRGDRPLWVNGDECTPTVDVCAWESGQPTRTTVLVTQQGDRPTWQDGTECTPMIDVCVWKHGAAKRVTVLATDQGDRPLWVNGDECTPTVTICVWENGAATAKTVAITQRGNAPLYKNGDECTPVVKICVWKHGKAQPRHVLATRLTGDEVMWVNGTECTPRVDICVWKHGAAKKVTVLATQQGHHPVWVNGDECAPPIAICVWDNGTATRVIVPATQQGEHPRWKDGSECTPRVDICVWKHGAAKKVTVLATQQGHHPVWVDGLECTPSSGKIDICRDVTNGDVAYRTGSLWWYAMNEGFHVSSGGHAERDGDIIPPFQVKNQYGVVLHDFPGKNWDAEGQLIWDLGCELPEQPSVDMSVLGGICDANAPYLQAQVTLTDPHGLADHDGTATLTFLHPTDPAQNYVISGVPLGTMQTYLWPGASVTEVDGETVATGWPGWELTSDGEWINIGDGNYGWTRGGVDVLIEVNPSVTLTLDYPPASAACDDPPSQVAVCEFVDGQATRVIYDAAAVPADSTTWVDGSECTPTVMICVQDGSEWAPLEIPVTGLQPTDRLWEGENGGCTDPREPSLTGSFLNTVCVADAPWLRYSIAVNDPDGVWEGSGPATVTFVNPHGGEDVVMELPLGTGYVLWPGATVAPAAGLTEADIDPLDPSTFVPTGWPGWAKNALDDWVSVGNDNYGWTRNGVTVTVEVNPSFDTVVTYPPATPRCAAAPPEEFTSVLGAPPPLAPPARAVDAVVNYAG